ncbi:MULTISPECIES: Uma2 family endonuclease [unclassified Nostoc]|uniref:Uma2 family endonuclease n=1 Tax=unclassified Nostoc TaxID=2593658 RepID=UPI00260DE31F|nr:Uma2 family endonuclease [Nostoc sp. S13]MDF5738357.1 Uma2 family endonuclease [Nostoc sp. S13]
MTSLLPSSQSTEVFYPSSDGEPLAESYVHLCALLATLEVLRQYLLDRQATVLSNQFLYYAQGFPRLRVAPDVMVIFNVAPGGRDNYKIWEEGQVPVVIFEMTSEGTRNQDTGFKKTLYEQLGVLEYWLFDPKGEWIKEQLQGYRLRGEVYELITDCRCEPLQLRLQIEGQLIGFYREDTGEKLLIPEELAEALKQERSAREQAQEQVKQAELQVERLKEQLRLLGVDPDTI